jgi:hypothetical protein
MDALPPNDPNGPNDPNRGNNHRNKTNKEQPHGPRNKRGRQGEVLNADGTMDVLGNMQDSPIVAAMFLIGVASWFLRTKCIC